MEKSQMKCEIIIKDDKWQNEQWLLTFSFLLVSITIRKAGSSMSFYHTCCWNMKFRHIVVVRVLFLRKLEWYDNPTCRVSYQCENIDVIIVQNILSECIAMSAFYAI